MRAVVAQAANAGTTKAQGQAGLADIGERTSRMGLEIADISGTVADLATLNDELLKTVKLVVLSARETTETNNSLAATMMEAQQSANTARTDMSGNAELIAQALSGADGNLQSLSQGVVQIMGSLESVRETITKVQRTSAAIQSISLETQLIALNAGVEAARAGEAGRAFNTIANAIKALADQVRVFANENNSNLAALQTTLDQLVGCARDNLTIAQSALESSKDARTATRGVQTLATGVQQLSDKIEEMSGPVQRNIASGTQVRDSLRSVVKIVCDADARIGAARAKAEAILGLSEDFMLFIAQSGIDTPDTSIIKLAQATAGQIGALFERAVAAGEISMRHLFDETYRPIPNTNPQQMMAAFTAFTDRVLPDLQEAVLKENERIVFCAAIDRNGYLPTHNKVYSKPQGSDPVWNAANCRNRRIFDDRTGLSAGRNTRPFLLQTYRRDMGNGVFVLMKDASAPVTVGGRHWGGFRIGFKA